MKLDDVYSQRTIKLMVENNFARYIQTMGKVDLPEYNTVYLVLEKVKEYEEIAKQQILAEAVKRKEEHEARRLEINAQ